MHMYVCVCVIRMPNKSARAAPRPRRTVRTIRAARAAGKST